MAINPELTKVRVRDTDICLRQWGDGEPLLMVHGLGGDGRLWREQVAPFGQHRRVLAVDLLGFGGSDTPHNPDRYDIDSLTADLIALVDQLGLQQVDFLGSSMGGFIGQTLALARPDLCRRLVLCHTAASMSIPADILNARVDALATLSMHDYAKTVVGQALAPESVERLGDEIVNAIASNDKWAYTQVLTKGLAKFDLRDTVSSISVPTLVLVGALDRVIPPNEGQALAERISGSELVSISNAGHLSYLEQPEMFNQQVLKFLNQPIRH